MTDPLGQSQVIPYLQGLSRGGYRIFLLSCEKEQVFENNRAMVENILTGYNIVWVPVSYTKNPPVISTLLDVMKLKKTAKKLHQKYGIDLVHTRPGIPSLVGAWMKRKFGVKFLNDIREFYADSRVDGGMWNTKNILYRTIYHYFKKQEALEVRESDGIVCLTHAAERIIRQWPEYDQHVPLTVIPCSADLNLFNNANVDLAEKEKVRAGLGIQTDDVIISYLGSIGGWYLTAEMMQFCKILSDKIPAAKFLFISPHHHQLIVDTAARSGLPEDKLITKQAKRPEVPVLLSFSDYSMFFIKPCYSKLSSSPTKHGEIMAMGIPVISNGGVGDVQEIVEKYDAGFMINEFSTGNLSFLAGQVAAGKIFDKEKIRRGAEEVYSLEQAVEKYREMYRVIFSNG